MTERRQWRVYGSAPAAVTVNSRWAARRLARKYARLGISATLYEADESREWVRRDRMEGQRP
jgi:hypothetical protein